MNLKKSAKKYLKAGFNIIPTTANKLPAVGNWTKYQVKPMSEADFEKIFNPEHNIGLLTGGTTRVVCFDADMKYDLSGTLWDRFTAMIPQEIMQKMMCQTTKNKGYHLVFRAPATRLFGNEKLAARPTTAYEQHQTYTEAFQNVMTMDNALKIALNDNSRILFETRSGSAERCGGYFLIYPSIGYNLVGGKIGELTEEEYDLLMETARSFNQVKSLEKPLDKAEYSKNWEISPFEHFNEEGDIISLLEESGWRQLPQLGSNIRLLRPGQTHASSSAMFDMNTRIFNCFSTSTRFDVGKGYTPASVFILLECDGDASLGYKKLIDLGFGVSL
jgi:hypothetical protein